VSPGASSTQTAPQDLGDPAKLSHRLTHVLLGIALVGIALLSCLDPMPGLGSPSPVWVAAPLKLFPPAAWVVLALYATMYWFGCAQLYYGDPRVPRHSKIIYALAVLAALGWSPLAFNLALRCQGLRVAIVLAGLNVAVGVSLGALLYRLARHPSWPLSVVFHWFFYAWIGSYAFAYLCEP
jgi:hypothetical protein